jgi:RNA polymerase sigma-70 factor (ECF subfamily)
LDETTVVLSCQKGDRDAFRLIVERYGDVLYGTAYLMTGDRPLAEDMVQEALVLAWRGIPRFRAGSNLKSWLVKILVNRVVSELRVRRRDLQLADDFDAPGGDEGVDVLLTAEEQARIHEALSMGIIYLTPLRGGSVDGTSQQAGIARIHQAERLGRCRSPLHG